MKSGGYYAPKFFLAIDETNTMWALIDNGSEKYNSNGLVDPLNSIGSRARLINNSAGTFDMSLFNNFTGRYIKHVLVNTDDYFLSLIERDGKYLWHKYALDFPYRYTTGDDVKVESSETGELAAEMFTNFKDAAFVYGYYGNWEWLFVASGNKLYGTAMDWNEPQQNSKEIFSASADIVSVKARYFGNSMAVSYTHLDVYKRQASFSYDWGKWAYNETLVNEVENADVQYSNVDRRVLTDRWQKPGDIAPLKDIKDIKSVTMPTSRFVQDDNELSLSALTLSYDFDTNFVKKLCLQRLRFELSSNDLFRISTVRQERGTSYPFARSVNFSLRATF